MSTEVNTMTISESKEEQTIFFKYNSIENSYQTAFVEKIKLAAPTGTKYMVQEKIHGANFGIFYDKETDTIQFGKRTSLVTAKDKFYNCHSHFPHWEKLTRQLVQNIGHKMEHSITIRGELCGGHYPDLPSKKPIQKGIDYCNEVVFVTFDLQIDGEYVPLNTAMTDLQLAGFHIIRILGVYDTLDEAMAFDIDFSSKLPKDLGMPAHPGKNQTEGIVIKPIETFFLPSGSRAVLKKKNEIHVERKKGPRKSQFSDKFSEAIDYLTIGRYQSVKSKLNEDFGIKDIGCAMIEDVLEDYLKDHEMADPKELKELRKKVSKVSFTFVLKCMREGL